MIQGCAACRLHAGLLRASLAHRLTLEPNRHCRPAQATQACFDLEQQLRDRQAEVAEAQAAERAAHEALDRQK